MEKNKIFKTKKEFWSFIVGLIIIVLLGYLGVKFVEIFIEALEYLFDNYTTIAVALVTGFLAFISMIVGKYLENRYTIKNQIRKERQAVYIGLLDWLINNVLNMQIENNENVVEEIREQQKLITIYASDKVLSAWLEFKSISQLTSEESKTMEKEEATKHIIQKQATCLENLILAIRKELGYNNKKIKNYDILKLYINDLNKYI